MSTSRTYLNFERAIAGIDTQIATLRGKESSEHTPTIKKLKAKAKKQLDDIYKNIDAWEKTQVARHPDRPHFSDYQKALITDYTPLSGDRKYGNDQALLGGIGKIEGRSIVIMGHEKGNDTDTRLKHNFGMAQPEGYRKAVRLMELAERFQLPVISFIDTAGAFPGREAEERGQAEAIARAIDKGLSIKVPFIAIITGEGGSGGAIAIATADIVIMLEHSIYSVISPEGCASILWRDGTKAKDAADAMKITASDLKKLGIIDHIIREPIGGAHREPETMISHVGKTIIKQLDALSEKSPEEISKSRREKFISIGRNLL